MSRQATNHDRVVAIADNPDLALPFARRARQLSRKAAILRDGASPINREAEKVYAATARHIQADLSLAADLIILRAMERGLA